MKVFMEKRTKIGERARAKRGVDAKNSLRDRSVSLFSLTQPEEARLGSAI